MTHSTLNFPQHEIEEARNLNRRLEWLPRFRARLPWDRFLVQSMLQAAQSVAAPHPAEVAIETRSLTCAGLKTPLRILRPTGPCRGVYVDFHGGGWSVGNARMDDAINARIAERCGVAVVSVDYELFPRARVPKIIEQCAEAAAWVFDHAEAEFGAGGIVIGGESAGAHLAASTVLRLREMRADFDRLKGVVLFYGAFDMAGTPSARAAGSDTLVLHGPTIEAGLRKLTPGMSDFERRHPSLSPLYGDLSRLPPALVLVGTLDPLFDDSRLLAERWQAQSGNAELVVAPEAPHAFNRFGTRMAGRTNGHVRQWVSARLGEAGTRSAVA